MCIYHDNEDNGLYTKIWGPPAWKSFHYFTFGYPNNPTIEDKINYKTYFEHLKFVMPCKFCRESYGEFIKTDPTILSIDTLISRNTLKRWGYDLHNRVNEKLGITYNESYEDFLNFYDSSRVKCLPNIENCISDPNNKIKALNKIEYENYLIINLDLAKKFIKYAETRNIDFSKLDYYYKISRSPQSKHWDKRNWECKAIISYMHKNMIPSLETDINFKNMPTLLELELILRLSTNLDSEYLSNIIKKNKIYKLIK
jgi:hypothetical protein